MKSVVAIECVYCESIYKYCCGQGVLLIILLSYFAIYDILKIIIYAYERGERI